MQFKTIFVYMSRRHGCERLLETACALARTNGAHLIGAAAFSAVPPVPPLAIPYNATVIQEMIRAAQEAEAELRDQFIETTRQQPFVSEWVSVRGFAGDLVGAVLEHARSADLIVAGQRDPDWELGPVLDFPERLALESGRPVYLVPRDRAAPDSYKSIAIAWNGSREAARAVYDAFPFLVSADNVSILTITADGKPMDEGTPAEALAATLARHGINATITPLQTSNAGVSRTIVNEATRLEADLLVMGAYGHSRLREFVFGGVTRDLTNACPIPLIISH
ncbi:MAG: universal stress protein [Alphaproteobacteria bacterium]|nr:universal stress protein [Alphaproteobacteria bacterium]